MREEQNTETAHQIQYNCIQSTSYMNPAVREKEDILRSGAM